MTNDTENTENTEYQYPDETQAARLRARVASRVAETPGGGLLAAALRRLQAAEGISPAEMAARLGTDAAGLDRLALCRMPRADRFAEDAETIADHCGCAVDALLPLLRRADVLATFAEPVPVPALCPGTKTAPEGKNPMSGWGVGALVAARDADDEDDTEADAGDE